MEGPLIVSLIFAAASFTQGVTGFGFGIIVMPLLSMLLDPGTAVAMNVLAGSVNCVYNYVLFRQYVQYRESLKTVFICSLFVPLGALFLVSVRQDMIFLFLGLLIMIISLHSMSFSGLTSHREIYRRLGIPFKIATGLVAGAFASPGPVLAPYYYAREENPVAAKADLQFIFSLLNIFVIASHIIAGNLNVPVFMNTLPYMPLVFLFTKLGAMVSLKLDLHVFKRVVHISLFFLGLYLIIQNLPRP